MSEAREERNAALRHALAVERFEGELRQRIRTSLWIRGCGSLFLGSIMAAVLGVSVYTFLRIPIAAPAIGVLLFAAFWSVYSLHERRRLRRVLSDLPPEQRSQTMRLLQASTNRAVQLISRPVLRELGEYPAELTPAEPPSGRGDEPTPAANRAE